MFFVFRFPQFPLIFDTGSTLLVARSKAELASIVAKLQLPANEERAIIDATGAGFCLFPEKLIVAPDIGVPKWTKLMVIDLFNYRRSPEMPEFRSTSLGNRKLAQIVCEAVELLAPRRRK